MRIAGGAAAGARATGRTSTSRPARCSSSATPSSRSTGSAGPTSRCTCARRRSSARHVTLTTNFRTVAPVLDWVNEVFAHADREDAEGAQPAYRRAGRPPRRTDERPATRSPCSARGRTTTGRTPRRCASARPPTSRRSSQQERLRPSDWHGADDERTAAWRAAAGSATSPILVPARTSLPFLEDALDRAGVAYRAESSSLVYQAPEVRDLLAAARAIADPSDVLALRDRAALAAVRLRRRRPVDVEAGRRARSACSRRSTRTLARPPGRARPRLPAAAALRARGG